MRILITNSQDKKSKQYPRLIAKDSSENQQVKFQKIEFYNKLPKQVKSSVVLKSLYKSNNTIHSFHLIEIEDDLPRQRRKSDNEGLISQKILNIDIKYPRTVIQQHQFLYRVKDLRRRAIRGRMKTKFEKSVMKIDTPSASKFNPLNHNNSNKDSHFASMQDIKVLRTFTKDRTYYQRPLVLKDSDLISDSPSEPSIQLQQTRKHIIFTPKQKQYVLLQLNKYKHKPFEQIKRDSIIKFLSETKETQNHTVPQITPLIQHRLQPYFSTHKKVNLKKSSYLSSFQRVKTII
ncbi:unnamed protein product (macronuclear) [Paramecium tetraurelia]|uniref:Uncharacterized protein n=1 Tax=Paramecium tetraurelia TaxID=5888 RepID=A0CXC3_PARTE|nr:uncharacterized protein GSPATT00011072001 [Paramecium tetraurelia]CAK75440.1 unnamed protein product [Paramecium tetraurelia]|eukprot:XP_001442837.1 hypothetical protein (macronuclear) [Paramecium tetraurelia strain d4-2]